MSQNMRPAAIAITAIPPTTPPAIAPTLVLLPPLGPGVGVDVPVDLLVVSVDPPLREVPVLRDVGVEVVPLLLVNGPAVVAKEMLAR
jgi:hypothetical protein